VDDLFALSPMYAVMSHVNIQRNIVLVAMELSAGIGESAKVSRFSSFTPEGPTGRKKI
jgi:hypothetical protein